MQIPKGESPTAVPENTWNLVFRHVLEFAGSLWNVTHVFVSWLLLSSPMFDVPRLDNWGYMSYFFIIMNFVSIVKAMRSEGKQQQTLQDELRKQKLSLKNS